MFGYVTICRDCMSDDEYNTFRAYYCGLCKETGRQCSQVSRLGLSYDITFLALLLSSLEEGEPCFAERRCAVHPCVKCKVVENDRAVSYAANMGVLLSYLKLADDWRDERSFKALFGAAFLRRGTVKAKKRYATQYEAIERELRRLDEYEKSGGGLDECADCFAKILECLFAPEFITDETAARVLKWFGYNLGRWIYVTDAYNDIEKDLKTRSYNPFLKNGADAGVKERVRDKTKFSLTLNLNELAAAYELLDIKKNDGIIRSVIYTSLTAVQNKVLGVSDGSV
ncbi:MAG: DUF5685 family protein [Firmicutes bacterium]|nr:DUF5685 family protein [Bacillota bacterium]